MCSSGQYKKTASHPALFARGETTVYSLRALPSPLEVMPTSSTRNRPCAPPPHNRTRTRTRTTNHVVRPLHCALYRDATPLPPTSPTTHTHSLHFALFTPLYPPPTCMSTKKRAFLKFGGTVWGRASRAAKGSQGGGNVGGLRRRGRVRAALLLPTPIKYSLIAASNGPGHAHGAGAAVRHCGGEGARRGRGRGRDFSPA